MNNGPQNGDSTVFEVDMHAANSIESWALFHQNGTDKHTTLVSQTNKI